jgi:predicted nucleotidyltransferase
MVAMDDIRETAARVGRAAKARRVYLFGSYARGDAREARTAALRVLDWLLQRVPQLVLAPQ